MNQFCGTMEDIKFQVCAFIISYIFEDQSSVARVPSQQTIII